MSTAAQIAANQANASLSTGPQTPDGKSNSSKNNFRHGMAGRFMLTPDDDRQEFLELAEAIQAEHNPQTPTETILVERMIESYWMSRKAIKYQAAALFDGDDDRLALMIRYQGTHDRSYTKCMGELAKLRNERAKQQIGFESQKRQEAHEIRRQELHQSRVRSLEVRSRAVELDTEIRTCVEAPMPGNVRISFEDLKQSFTNALRALTAGQVA